jgi:uncharacterized surface protein with fasciclin (FAS1) repeats
MLRRVLAVGQGRAERPELRAVCSARALGLAGLALLTGLSLADPAHAAEPFPPSEASEHFDAQARANKKDMLATLQADPRFQALVRALDATGLASLLRARGPLTMFVPTDAAFDKLPAGRLEQWIKQPKTLRAILRYHMLKAYVPSKQLSRLRNALTTAGALVTIDGTSGIKVNGVSVISTDLHASNGVLHVIDTLLVPPEAKSSSGKKRRGGKSADSSEGQGTEPAEGKPQDARPQQATGQNG